jgi:threonine/homoserine/homoserine lactone efflux protein
MSQAANLWVYFVVVFGIVALPGLDMAFDMGSALLGGRRSGLAAVGGILAGGLCHLAMGALGVAAVLALWPPLFDLMLAAGAVYVAWTGLLFLHSASVFAPPAGKRAGALAPGPAFRRAVLTSLVNPKAYLFMLAIFPQFLRPGSGPVWAQAAALGVITSLTQAGVYGAVALAASRAAGWLAGHPAASVATARVMGVVLLGVAVLTFGQIRLTPYFHVLLELCPEQAGQFAADFFQQRAMLPAV